MPIDPITPLPGAGFVPTPTAHVATATGDALRGDADRFARDGGSSVAPTGSTHALPVLGGPPSRRAAAETTFAGARARYDEVWTRWRGSGIRFYDPSLPISVPSEVRGACDALLAAGAELLRARGVAVSVDRASGNLTIRPDSTTALGRYATQLSAYGEQALFNPTLLWVHSAHGHHDVRNRMVFASVDAVAEGRPGATEGHELIHARLHHRFHVEERYHLLNAWLTPTAGTTLFGPGRNYSRGFSLEELSTSVHDLVFEAGGVDGVRALAEHLNDRHLPYAGDAAADARRALAAVDHYVTQLNRPSLPEVVRAAAQDLLATSAIWSSGIWQRAASDYYDDFTRVDAATGRYVKRQVLRQGDADAQVRLELTHYPLFDKSRRVVGALLCDLRRGLRLELPILDPSAAALVTADGCDAEALARVTRRFVVPRLQALCAVAESQVVAYEQLRRAAAGLRTALDTGTTSGPAAQAFAAALAELEATRWHEADAEPQTAT